MIKVFVENIEEVVKNDQFESLINVYNVRSEKRRREKKAGEILLIQALQEENIVVDKPLSYIYKGTKPYLKDYPYYHNISHCNDVIVLVISDQEIGIDVEEIKPRAKKLAHSILSTDEMNNFLNISEDTYEASVIKLWTIKEAFLKYTGKGISRLRKVRLDKDVVKTDLETAKHFTFKYKNYFISLVTNVIDENMCVIK